MKSKITTKELFECKTPYLISAFNSSIYPWELLSKIDDIIKDIVKSGEFKEISEGVFVGDNVKISDKATIIAPAVIGSNTEIRPGAYLRGKVITGENCVIGNSSEIKNSILLNHVQVPHYNYVGDSILGNHSHLGAGAICSNLKADGSNVEIHAAEINTGLRKLGAILADYANIGCGCVLNPGTVICKNTSAYPLLSLRGIYPEESIIKSNDNIVKRR